MKLVDESGLAAALDAIRPHVAALDAAVAQSKELLEGNILYMHQSTELNPKNEAKQRNLLSLAASLPVEDSLVIEIGFNAGHSSLLMLSAHPQLRIIAFDLCEHSYTRPCFNILADAFPGRLQLVPGRSQQTLPRWARENQLRADLIHIDGAHEPEAAKADLQNAKAVARHGAWVVFDDTCFSPLRAVWGEALESQLVEPPSESITFCPTNRHGIARYVRAPARRAAATEDLLWELAPVLEHRGRMRHVLVLAPTDHGQDSLLGYLSKHRLWRGNQPATSKKLCSNNTQRHQSPWLSLPLRCDLPGDLPCLVQLVAPHFSNLQQISDCFPLVDGALLVVDCAEGLTEEFCQIFGKAVTQGLQPVLFLNKLDKLLSLEGDNELCYQRLAQIIDRLNDIIEESPARLSQLAFESGNVIFGRGSLSVAESIGGWGFGLDDLVAAQATRKNWTADQVAKLKPRLWGEHFYNGRTWGSSGERGFCKLVLQPLREIFTMLESATPQEMQQLRSLGIVPKDNLVGNAWKQSAMEAWLPLVDILVGVMANKVPAPAAPPSNSVFYAARCLQTTDGQHLALGRHVDPQQIAHLTLPQEVPVTTGICWLLNGPAAVPLSTIKAAPGAMLGIPVESASVGAITVG
eukprot:s352_g40.t1